MASNLEKFDFMYDVLSKKFDRQISDYTGLMNKANFLFTFAGTFFAVYLIFLFDKGLTTILINLSGLMLLISTLFCINQAIKARTFEDPPPIDSFYSRTTLGMDLGEIKDKTLASIRASYNRNAKVLDTITNWYKWAQWLLFATFVIIVLTNIIALYGKQISEVPKNKPYQFEKISPHDRNRAEQQHRQIYSPTIKQQERK